MSESSNACLAADLRKYYVDEATGNDETGDGSEQLPYKSVVGAYVARETANLDLLIRKLEEVKTEPSTHTPADSVAPLSQAPWHPITKSAQKKGATLFQQHQKKQAKAAELAAKDRDKEGSELRRLEEAKKLVLVEPVETAKRIKIRQSKENRERRVRLFGWVHRLRQQSGLTFIVLRDGTGYLQCVMSGKLVRDMAFNIMESMHVVLMLSNFSLDPYLRRHFSHERILHRSHRDDQSVTRGQDCS